MSSAAGGAWPVTEYPEEPVDHLRRSYAIVADRRAVGVLASGLLRLRMAVFHLECSIHRRCSSGISVASEQITAPTEAEAIADADTRFSRLLAHRSGVAILRDDAGRTIWTKRQTEPVNS